MIGVFDGLVKVKSQGIDYAIYANQQMVIDNDFHTQVIKANINFCAWLDSVFFADNTSLPDLFDVLEDKFDVRIFSSAKVKSLAISGTIPMTTLSKSLAIIAVTLSLNIRQVLSSSFTSAKFNKINFHLFYFHSIYSVDTLKNKGTKVNFRLSRLAAISALLTSQFSATVFASDTVNINIQQAPLSQCLQQLNRQTSILVTFELSKNKQIQCSPVYGKLTAKQALNALLHNTGYVAQQKENNHFVLLDENTIASLPDMQVTSIETIEVYGKAVSRSSSPTGLDLSAQETPQSISIIDIDFIQDYGLDDIEKVLNNTTGVYRYKYGTSDDTLFSARGFYVNDYVKDGMPAGFSSGQEFRLDSTVYESVEVLRGAAGLMAGAGEPSATINLMTKRPTRDPLLNLSAQLGSFNHKRVDIDASSALTSDGKHAARIVLAYEDQDTFVDRENKEKKVFYTQFHSYLGEQENTEARFTIHYQGLNHRGLQWGIPVFYDNGSQVKVDESTNLASPYAYQDREHIGYTLKLTHQLNLDWELNAAVYYGTNELKSIFSYFAAPSFDMETGLGLLGQDASFNDKGTVRTITASAIGRIEAFDREHQINLTYLTNETEYDSLSYEERENGERVEYALGSIFDKNPAGHLPKAIFNTQFVKKAEDISEDTFAISGKLDMSDALDVVLGIKFYQYKEKRFFQYLNFPASDEKSDDNGSSKYLGLVYSFTDTVNAYASYTDTYKPQFGMLNENLKPLNAITGQNIELGIKASLLNDDLMINLALFDTLLKNVGEVIPEYAEQRPVRYREVDGANSKGFELEVSGKITENWDLIFGYTQFNLEDQDGDKVNREAPRKLLKINSLYSYNDFTFGLALQWNDDTKVNVRGVPGIDLGLPLGTRRGALLDTKEGHALLSAHLGYQVTEQLDVKLHVRNLLDKDYYDTYGFVPKKRGEPRAFNLTMNYKF